MTESTPILSAWDDAHAGPLCPEDQLIYRSNLLGADRRVTNFGGGNTSAKLDQPDPLTRQSTRVLWVKGSGGDLGTIKRDGFATLYMDKLLRLADLYRGAENEDEMVRLYPHCTFNLNARAPSIDTPLHAYIEYAHVDHMHPDAVIAVAATAESRSLTRAIYGDEIGWLQWLRPGFELGLRLRQFVREHPEARGVVLEAHGLFTWGATSRACYENTLHVINLATAWIGDMAHSRQIFGGQRSGALPTANRREIAAFLMPRIRGMISAQQARIGHFDDSPAVLDFVGSHGMDSLAALGTSCPDHFLRTKIWPLVLSFDPHAETVQDLVARLPDALEKYREKHRAYYERCKRPDSPRMRDPNAVVYLIPGVGMLTFAADKAAARIAGEFYVNAINVMRGADAISKYRGLPEQEAFDIEYWLLEEAKLQRMPKPRALAGKIALVTGGAGGIGLAVARRLMSEGAAVVLCDIDAAALAGAECTLRREFDADSVVGLCADVTNEASIESVFREAACAFGGIDICVSNAGIASAAPIESTTLALWQKNLDILATGYFLVAREAVRLLKSQAIGGSIIFIGSKNGLAASPGAAAYCAAKASEIHLARCLALECASDGIRVNVVNPDAVLRGSRIWQGEWAEQRAKQNNTSVAELEAVYRERSLLKRSVYPEDVAEAVAHFASERSAKSTGNILNVDAGNAAAFTR